MKYLHHYMEEKQSKLFKETGAFFAFSSKQFKERKQENTIYVDLGAGLIVPGYNANKLYEGLDIIHQEAMRQDIEANGIEGIIKRELYNHEAFYTGCTMSTIDALEGYDEISEDMIDDIYRKEYYAANN